MHIYFLIKLIIYIIPILSYIIHNTAINKYFAENNIKFHSVRSTLLADLDFT